MSNKYAVDAACQTNQNGIPSRSTEMADLPQDVIDEVLYRLPAKSIGRCRCVSKPWRSLLSSPKFAESHFEFHRRRRAAAPIAINSRNLSTFPADGSGGRSRKGSREITETMYRVLAASGGWVLCNKYPSMYVLNPLTLDYFELPFFDSFVPPRVVWHSEYGMGYDSLSGDFKIVQVWDLYPDDNDSDLSESDWSEWSEEYDGLSFVDVYSFKNKCWKTVGKTPYLGFNLDEAGVYMNGCIHWVNSVDESVSPCGYAIAAFSLAREEFEDIPFPKEFVPGRRYHHRIAVLRECMAIISYPWYNDCGFEVWLMKEYGVRESWEKLVVISTPGRQFKTPRVLFLSREDELFFADGDLLLFAYSLTTGVLRYIALGEDSYDYDPRAFRDPTLFTFTECLLSPNHL